MEDILKADIFFFITSIAVIVFTVGLSILVYMCIRLVRSITRITDLVHDEAVLVKEDIDGVRESVRANAEVVGTIIGAVARKGAHFMGATPAAKKKSHGKKSTKKEQ